MFSVSKKMGFILFLSTLVIYSKSYALDYSNALKIVQSMSGENTVIIQELSQTGVYATHSIKNSEEGRGISKTTHRFRINGSMARLEVLRVDTDFTSPLGKRTRTEFIVRIPYSSREVSEIENIDLFSAVRKGLAEDGIVEGLLRNNNLSMSQSSDRQVFEVNLSGVTDQAAASVIRSLANSIGVKGSAKKAMSCVGAF